MPLFPVLLLFSLGQERSPEARREEGSLENKTMLPAARDPEVERLLGEGDARLREGRFAAAIDAWTRALARSAEADGLFVDDRFFVSVREAIRRRAAALPPEGRSVWASRVEAPAAAELAAAGADEVRLARILDERPGTLASARAALRLGDAAFERGEAAAAAALYRLAATAGDAPTRGAAIARRSSAALRLGDRAEIERLLAEAADAPPIEAEGRTLPAAEWLEALAGRLPPPLGPSSARLAIAWSPLSVPEDSESGRSQGFDPHPAVAGGEAFVQTRRSLHVCDLARGTFVGKVDLEEILPLRPRVEDGRGIRRTRPAAEGSLVAVVHGETSTTGSPSNALALFERTTGGEAPLRLRWARLPGGGFLREGGGREKDSRLEGFVFSEEPLLYGERLYCGLQRVAGEVASYLAAFDARSGALLFLRWLAKGSEVDPLLPRNGRGAANVSGSGPVASGGVVFYGTNLGVVVALDGRSGECLFAYKTARRTPLEVRESPRFPDLAHGRPVAGARGFAIAPGDSAFLYAFPIPGVAGASTLLHPPLPLREAILYAGWCADGHVFLANSGGEQNVAAFDPLQWRRVDSAPLGPEEAFLSPDTDQPREPALARGRVFAASERYLYVFDLGRELYMEAAIPPPIDPRSGLYGSGRAILGNLVPTPDGVLSATPRSLVLFREERG
ncbi:MAG TPA: hypothetical protein VFI25_03215 [Planctomycetota bacterium]|nr:hypothetical protein [Planctomycetota bacterium]